MFTRSLSSLNSINYDKLDVFLVQLLVLEVKV